jgi:hypothetical protein
MSRSRSSARGRTGDPGQETAGVANPIVEAAVERVLAEGKAQGLPVPATGPTVEAVALVVWDAERPAEPK